MNTIEWRKCPRCGKPCNLIPISPIFDKTGEKYGFQFVCVVCNWIETNQFFSYEQVKPFLDDKKEPL